VIKLYHCPNCNRVTRRQAVNSNVCLLCRIEVGPGGLPQSWVMEPIELPWYSLIFVKILSLMLDLKRWRMKFVLTKGER